MNNNNKMEYKVQEEGSPYAVNLITLNSFDFLTQKGLISFSPRYRVMAIFEGVVLKRDIDYWNKGYYTQFFDVKEKMELVVDVNELEDSLVYYGMFRDGDCRCILEIDKQNLKQLNIGRYNSIIGQFRKTPENQIFFDVQNVLGCKIVDVERCQRTIRYLIQNSKLLNNVSENGNIRRSRKMSVSSITHEL